MRWESCARSQINNGKLSKSEPTQTLTYTHIHGGTTTTRITNGSREFCSYYLDDDDKKMNSYFLWWS